MSTAAHRAGSAQVVELLALYRRYADLVAAQEAALEADDLEGVQALAGDLDAIRAAIGRAGPPPRPGSGDRQEAAAAHEAADLLRAALSRTQRIQARLEEMRARQARAIRAVRDRRSGLRTYAAATGAAHALDVRL